PALLYPTVVKLSVQLFRPALAVHLSIRTPLSVTDWSVQARSIRVVLAGVAVRLTGAATARVAWAILEYSPVHPPLHELSAVLKDLTRYLYVVPTGLRPASLYVVTRPSITGKPASRVVKSQLAPMQRSRV